jgi:hypothetical protein
VFEAVLDAEGNAVMEPAYNLRYLRADGTQMTAEEYAAEVAAGKVAYRAALTGSVYK